MSVVEVKTRILAGGRVEIPSTDLPEGSEATVAEAPEEFIDESNPFYAAKKAQQLQAKQGPAGPAKAKFNDTSDAAGDILRRLMERRRAEKSS